MPESTTAPTSTTPPTSNNGGTTSGTAPANTGPGSGTALEAALTTYLANQLKAAGDNGSYGPLPVPQGSAAPNVTVIQAAPTKLPFVIGAIGAVIGIASGAAYLMDRRKHHA